MCLAEWARRSSSTNTVADFLRENAADSNVVPAAIAALEAVRSDPALTAPKFAHGHVAGLNARQQTGERRRLAARSGGLTLAPDIPSRGDVTSVNP